MEAMGKSAGGFDALNISPEKYEKWEDLPPEMTEIHGHISKNLQLLQANHPEL